MPAETTDSDIPQKAFPFMQLPPELRVMVYKLALQDMVDPILCSGPGDAEDPKAFHGALALVHTSRLVRLESCRDMYSIVTVHRGSLVDILNTLVARMEESRATTPTASCAHLHDQYGKVWRQYKCVGVLVCWHMLYFASTCPTLRCMWFLFLLGGSQHSKSHRWHEWLKVAVWSEASQTFSKAIPGPRSPTLTLDEVDFVVACLAGMR
jgi:hypothetical protein